MSSSTTLRRSTRQLGKEPIRYSYFEIQSYPGGAPATKLERMVATLDSEAFLSYQYARVDDAIVFAFFNKKRQSGYYNRLQLRTIGSGDLPTADEGLNIAHLCFNNITRDDPTVEECRAVAERVIQLHPRLFSPGDVQILCQ
jgi:hypothetical protein